MLLMVEMKIDETDRWWKFLEFIQIYWLFLAKISLMMQKVVLDRQLSFA